MTSRVPVVVEVCEERILLTVTPSVSLAQAEADVADAQAALDDAIEDAEAQAVAINEAYSAAMAGHSGDYQTAVDALVAAYNGTLDGINAAYSASVGTLTTAFNSTVEGLEQGLDGDITVANDGYTAAMTTA